MPTASTPRLADLDPEGVAREVCEMAASHVTQIASWLGVVEPRFRKPSDCILGLTAARLTRWAQTGAGMRSDEVDDAIRVVRQALYSRAADEVRELTPELDAEIGDPTNTISCVLLAALARRVVAVPQRGKLVRARWLAALASVAESRVHQLAAEGRLRRVAQAIQTTDARKWLEERGVAGL